MSSTAVQVIEQSYFQLVIYVDCETEMNRKILYIYIYIYSQMVAIGINGRKGEPNTDSAGKRT